MSTPKTNAAALAALSICETILLALVEEDVVDQDLVQEMLEDAVEGHRAAEKGQSKESHDEAALLVEQVLISLNAIRRGSEIGRPKVAQKLNMNGGSGR